ncbi:MAG: MFS transporter [Dethiobacter sp.]|jgi:MFS family permease|nr:MAG: MFS transporter [Dethiobacter sp.]
MEKLSGVTEQLKPRLLTLNFALICLSNLTLYMVFHSLNTSLPIYIKQFGGTTKIAGLALTSLTVAAIISRPLTGWSLDKYGRKLLLIGGLLLFLIPSIIYIWMIPVLLLIIFRFVQGLGWGIGHTAVSTVALDIVPSERMGEGLGFFSLFNSVSMALSPAIALWLIYHYSFRELFIVCFFLMIGTFFVVLLIRYPIIEKQLNDYKFKFMEKAALRPALIIFLVLFANSSVTSFLALYAIDLGLKTAGFFFTAMALTTLISRPLSGLIVDRLRQKGFDICFVIGAIAVVIAILVLVLSSTSLHLVVAGLLYGLCSGFIYSIMLVLSIRSVFAGEKGAANATYWTALDMGVALGSLFWGFIAAAFGYRLMFNLTIIPILIAIFIYFKYRISNVAQ